jgi:hypothetical protein
MEIAIAAHAVAGICSDSKSMKPAQPCWWRRIGRSTRFKGGLETGGSKSMSFLWITEPTNEETAALRDYKDNVWERLNCGLRHGTLDENLRNLDQLLDSVTAKGINPVPLNLYRATSTAHVPALVGEEFSDPSYLSTSLRAENLAQFYDAQTPAKLIIKCPGGTPMAAFACDDGIGEEQERLLGKGTRIRVDSAETVNDEARLLAELCTCDRRWAMRRVVLLVLRVSICY